MFAMKWDAMFFAPIFVKTNYLLLPYGYYSMYVL